MILSDKESKEAEGLSDKHPVVKKMLDEIRSIEEDGIKTLYISFNKKLKVIAQQIDEAEININAGKDDKVFDRVFKAMVEGAKIASSLRTLKQEIYPTGEEVSSSGKATSMTDKWANENQQV